VELAGMPGTASVFPVLRHGASPEAVRRSAVEQKVPTCISSWLVHDTSES
jgi:hypothetical protein